MNPRRSLAIGTLLWLSSVFAQWAKKLSDPTYDESKLSSDLEYLHSLIGTLAAMISEKK